MICLRCNDGRRPQYPNAAGDGCLTWRCPACREDVPYCQGDAQTELCCDCAVARKAEMGTKIERLRAHQRGKAFRLAVLTTLRDNTLLNKLCEDPPP